MRVLHVDTGREMRGGQWQALYLSEGLAARGYDSLLLARGALLETAKARGARVEPLAGTGLLSARRWPGADLIHVHDARAHTLAAAGARRPFVVSRRVAFPPRTGPLSRWKYGRAEHFIAVSQCVRTALETAGIAPERISVVYDGVPLRPPARGGAHIVAPATEDPRKGSDLLRQAAALGGFEVHFSTSLAADLEDAAVFVYITREEGLGSGVLLAMAAGVPVAASRVGGLPEILTDGETGILTGNEPAAIAAGVRRAAGDRAMGERGRQQIAGRFSVEAMIRGTLAVYDRILACSRPS